MNRFWLDLSRILGGILQVLVEPEQVLFGFGQILIGFE